MSVSRLACARLLSAILSLALAAACTSDGNGGGLDTTFAAQMASSWHYVDAPQRVQVGIFGNDANGRRVVTGGSIELVFSYLGPDGSASPTAGGSATASYVPVPGTRTSGDGPTLSSGDRGVYQASDVAFDQAGVWRITLDATIDGVARQLTTDLVVTEESPIPAPGDRAPKTENLTLDSKVREGAIDSRADAGGGIPDPELHEWTIADAIEEGRPALVLIGTPAYCTSQFCGPEVDELQRLATEYPDRAVFIHVEVWKDYNAEPQVVNQAAADWLLRDGAMTEPWLFLIGADGIVADRWGSLFDVDEVETALEAMPPMAL